MSWEAFKNIYRTAYELGCKSCATFNVSGKRAGLLRSVEDEGASCAIDSVTGRQECA